jgi:uncharacterized protein YigE (DUF2233 family)
LHNIWIVQTRFPLSVPFIVSLLLLFHVPATEAGRAERINYRSAEFIVYWVDLASDELSLYWRDSGGKALGSFARLREHLGSRGADLKFAINAGIFSPDYEPLGLHVEESAVLRKLNLGDMEGGQLNFYMKPNGVFYVADRTPAIVESALFARLDPHPRIACQSGPLLVSRGKVHPSFRPRSGNLHWRSAVGVTKSNQVVFAISKAPICFHDFARFFQARLGCDNALYLDGDICAIYLPEFGYRGEDPKPRFAGMFAVTARPKAAFESP